jgi:hypothetical protein
MMLTLPGRFEMPETQLGQFLVAILNVIAFAVNLKLARFF